MNIGYWFGITTLGTMIGCTFFGFLGKELIGFGPAAVIGTAVSVAALHYLINN